MIPRLPEEVMGAMSRWSNNEIDVRWKIRAIPGLFLEFLKEIEQATASSHPAGADE